MEIIGRNPRSPVGRRFDVSLWEWRPIQDLLVHLCSDLIDEELLTGLGRNDGWGPSDQATCRTMASRFDLWLERHIEGHEVDLDLRVTKQGEFVLRERAELDPSLETRSAYRVADETLKGWVDFLGDCGGFEVW
jgi:hypothetical protein